MESHLWLLLDTAIWIVPAFDSKTPHTHKKKATHCASVRLCVSLSLCLYRVYLLICIWLFVQLNAMQLRLLQLYSLFRSSINECLNMPSSTQHVIVRLYLLICLSHWNDNCNYKFKTDVSAVFASFEQCNCSNGGGRWRWANRCAVIFISKVSNVIAFINGGTLIVIYYMHT